MAIRRKFLVNKLIASRRALIFGVSGQSGSYLARFLLSKGYQVWGTFRDLKITSFSNLHVLGIEDAIHLEAISSTDESNIQRIIKEIQPHEIYNLMGQSSVGCSFTEPVETTQSIVIGTLNILEAIRLIDSSIRFFNAGSSEVFGGCEDILVDEETAFKPLNPYAVAKASATWLVKTYRESYGLFACTGILFNHESPLRPTTFVSRKITQTLVRIKLGLDKCLYLGNVDIQCDWGHAADYVEVEWQMLQQDKPEDYVIASGVLRSVKDFVNSAAKAIDISLCWKGQGIEEKAFSSSDIAVQKRSNIDEIIAISPEYFRPVDGRMVQANLTKLKNQLGWAPKITFEGLVREMVESELKLINQEIR